MDRREAILARLVDIGREVVGRAVRNRDEVTGRGSPVAVILDGAEEAVEMERRPLKGIKCLVAMTPEIYVLVGQPSETVGTDLSVQRAALLKAIADDATLKDITGPSGAILFEGSSVSTSWGETREGRLQISIGFRYLLDPAEL